MEQYLYLIPLLPLLAFAINLLFGRFLRTAAHWIATPAVFASFLLSLLVFRQISATGEPLRQDLYTWIQSGTFHIGINLFVDQLTAVMLIVVTSVGFLVHVYSKGYMEGDPGFARFFAYLPFFVFSMLMLVLADNFLLLFFFWEGVGLASYLLIGFWFTRRSAAGAAQKAFIVNRIGDLAFGLGLIWIFYQFGTLDFSEVFAQVPAAPAAVVTGIALLLFGGAAGKSAQFPLHVWLPDAMEGPTPVSALIHAATMVTAGIYLIVRTHTFYESAPTAMLVVALIGAFTSFMAATIAVAQNDIKRVVAYSTLSQLGYMAMGAGVGAFIPAIFHLVTHAFFKGCLFLGAGSVIHGMHEEQNIQRMGGLRALDAGDVLDVPRRLVRQRGHDPLRRVLVEGRDHPRRLGHGPDPDHDRADPGHRRAGDGLLHRVLHVPARLPRLHRRAAVRPARDSSARVAAVDGDPAGAAGDPVGGPRLVDRLAAGSGLHPRLPGAGLPGCERHAPRGTRSPRSTCCKKRPLQPVKSGRRGARRGAATEEHHVSQETTIAFGVASTVAAVAGIGLAYLIYSRRTMPAPEERASAALSLPARQMAVG